MRCFMIFLVLLQFGCDKFRNGISVARLDCGQDATFDGSYLRFIDSAGNELDRKSLDIRSLDGPQGSGLNATSKGCVTADKPGLWLVRHKERLEALVFEIESNQLSGFQQLHDISHENLKPVCPVHDISETLDPAVFLASTDGLDKRGYFIRLMIHPKTSSNTIDLPMLNLAFFKPALVATLVPEGKVLVDIELKNQFRLGETMTLNCSVSFDYTAPLTYSSIEKTTPVSYRSRPLYELNAEDDLNFIADNKDVVAHEVCWQARKDWDEGVPIVNHLEVCSHPQKVERDKNVIFSDRKGFWQLQYRGSDQAGNVSHWSRAVIVLLKQTSSIEKLKIKANSIATIVEAKPVDGAANAMVSALELHQGWLGLPTQYERDTLENVVLLSMHRPWLRDMKWTLCFRPAERV
ncbi:MAG: hypothetical protein M3Q07_19675 [Pseudobdellovibrionaceae bacterium]|nr:hypothetical protein [Pseudobdellovibrionaceae bacterium]